MSALITLSSRTMANNFPTLFFVASPNFLAPIESNLKETIGRLYWSKLGWASTRLSPLTITCFLTARYLLFPLISSGKISLPGVGFPGSALTDVSTKRNWSFAVLPSRFLIRVGSSRPGSWTRIRSSPCCWIKGSAVPVSSTRRRTISIDCARADFLRSLMALTFKRDQTFRC